MQKLMSTRSGTVVLGIVAAVLSGGLLLIYLAQYRDSLNTSSQKVSVLEANQVIPKKTPGRVIASQGMYQVIQVPKSQVQNGAITDPSVLNTEQVSSDILPGQQLVESDFTTTPAGAVTSQLSGYERAMAVSVDTAHGLLGTVQAGDYVDVLVGFNVTLFGKNGQSLNGGTSRPVVKTVLQNVLVLSAPTGSGNSGLGGSGNGNGVVTLRLTDQQAGELALASDNGKIWLTERPLAGAQAHAPTFASLEMLLFGISPVTAERSFGANR